MIAYLRGVIIEKLPGGVVLDVGGVGYFAHLSNSSLDKLPPVGREAAIHTHLNVREDALQIYGFIARAEKELFELLIGVNGVGPKVALAILSSYDVDTLKRAIAGEDAALLTEIPGIGKKSALRIILELKEKLKGEGVVPALSPLASAGSIFAEAHGALVSLGYSAVEARMAIDGYEGEESAKAIVKFALQRLALK